MLTVPTNLFFSTTKYNAVILSEQSSRIPIFIMPTGPLHMQIPLHVFIILDTRLTRLLCARHSTRRILKPTYKYCILRHLYSHYTTTTLESAVVSNKSRLSPTKCYNNKREYISHVSVHKYLYDSVGGNNRQELNEKGWCICYRDKILYM